MSSTSGSADVLEAMGAYIGLSAEQVAEGVRALVAELGAAGPGDMGRVMAAAKSRFAGQAEMALVSAAVKQALAAAK